MPADHGLRLHEPVLQRKSGTREYKTIIAEEAAGLVARAAALDREGRLVIGGYVRYEGGGYAYAVSRHVFRPLE